MTRTILIADDSPTVQKKASGILTGEGMEVVTVSNGVAAIKKLPTVKPMVILADVSMPGKDGYEVCEFVKGSAEFPNVPVLLVFSDDDIYDEQKGARARADGRIRKPFDPAELVSTVTRFLAISEAAHTPLGATVVYKIPTRARPAPPPVVEPIDEEPEYVPKKAEPDLSALEGGMALGETPLEEMEAPPAEGAPVFESFAPLETPPAFEPAPEPEPEPTPSFESAAPFEAPPVAEPEFPPPHPEQPAIAEEAPAAYEAATEPAPEMATSEPMAPPQEEVPAEPVFIEEQAAPPPPPPSPTAPEFGRTMMFRLTDIAQPVLSDEMAPAPAAAEQEAAEVTAEAAAAEPEGPPVSAASLDSYSLSEAAAGHVRFVAPEEEAPAVTAAEEVAPPAVEEGVAAPAEISAAPAAPAVDSSHVYTIVQMVVTKMSPRMGPQAIAELAKSLADEINAELNASSPPNA